MKTFDITKGIKNVGNFRVITGRDLGLEQRKKHDLENKDKDGQKYIILFNSNVRHVNPSFFLGAFGPSVRVLGGRNEFLDKYNFDVKDTIWKSIEEGIEDAISNYDPYSK